MIVVITKENIEELKEIYANTETEEIGVEIDNSGISFINRTGACGESFQVLDLENYRNYDFTAYEILDDFIDCYNAVAPEKIWQFKLAFKK